MNIWNQLSGQVSGAFGYMWNAVPSTETVNESASRLKDAASKAFEAAKQGAIKSVVWYQGYGRESYVQILQKLWDKPGLEASLVGLSVPLTNFCEQCKPELYAQLSQGNQNTFKNMLEGLILYVAVNMASALYPEKMRKLKAGDELLPDETVPFEQFCADVIAHLSPMILDAWIQLDLDQSRGAPINDQKFHPLVGSLLDFMLPKQEEGRYAHLKATSNWFIYKNLAHPYLTAVIKSIYLSWIGKGAAQPQGIPLDHLMPLFGVSLPVVIRSVTKVIMPETPASFDLIFRVVSAFLPKIKPILQEFAPLIQEVSDEDLGRLVCAILVHGIKNLSPEGAADLDFPHALLFLRDQLYRCFQAIQHKRSLGQKISVDDFRSSAKALLMKLLQHHPQALEMILRRIPRIEALFADSLMQLEAGFRKNLDLEPQRQRLREVFWDRDKFQAQVKGGGILPLVPSKELSEIFEVEELIRQIETLCQNIGFSIVKHLKEFIGEEGIHIKIAEQLQIPGVEVLLNDLIAIAKNEDWQNEAILGWTQEQITAILFTVISLALKKGAVKAGREQALFTVVEHLLTAFVDLAPKHKEEVKKFKPLARDLIALFFESPEDHLKMENFIPLPGSLAVKVADLLKTSIVPGMLQMMDHGFLALSMDKKAERKRLGNRYLDELSRVLGRYVEEFVPYFLENEGEMVASSLVDELKVYLCRQPDQVGEEDFEVDLAQDKPHEMLSLLIQNALVSISKGNSPISKPLFALLGRYTESIVRRAMIHFSQYMKKVEVQGVKKAEGILREPPQVEAVKGVLEVAHAHMERVNLVTNNLRAKNSTEVPEEVLLDHFLLHHELHPLLNAQDPAQSVMYLRDFSRKLNQLFGLDEEKELPAPDFFKPLLHEWIQHLMPIIWQELLKAAKSPEALESYLHSLLVSIRSPLEKDENNPLVYEGAVQEEIELVSGRLLQELIGLHPSVAQPLIRYRGVSELVGRAVGQSLRGALEKYSLQELLNQLIKNALPALHPGRWISEEAWQTWKETKVMPPLNPDAAAERFFPLRVNSEGEVERGWNFGFPRTPKAREERNAADKEEGVERRRKVRHELKDSIAQQAKLSIDAGAKGLWNDFQKSFDQAFAEIFGQDGTQLKRLLDKVCGILWKFVIQPLFKVIAFPTKKLLVVLLGYYCAIQARARVQEIAHPIHQNVLLRSLDSIVNFLSVRAVH